MAPDGDVYWFGIVTEDGESARRRIELAQYIVLDEDFSPGVEASIAPWMRVTVSLPADVDIDVHYIYYETSEYEEIVGGRTRRPDT